MIDFFPVNLYNLSEILILLLKSNHHIQIGSKIGSIYCEMGIFRIKIIVELMYHNWHETITILQKYVTLKCDFRKLQFVDRCDSHMLFFILYFLDVCPALRCGNRPLIHVRD